MRRGDERDRAPKEPRHAQAGLGACVLLPARDSPVFGRGGARVRGPVLVRAQTLNPNKPTPNKQTQTNQTQTNKQTKSKLNPKPPRRCARSLQLTVCDRPRFVAPSPLDVSHEMISLAGTEVPRIPTPCTLHPTYTLHPAPYTLHPIPFILHHRP